MWHAKDHLAYEVERFEGWQCQNIHQVVELGLGLISLMSIARFRDLYCYVEAFQQ